LFQPFPMLPGRTAQLWRHQPAFRRPRHFHEEPELNVVLGGRARLGVGERVFELGAGELVAFEPGQDHVLLDASPDLELFVVALRPELGERVRGARPRVHKDKLVLEAADLESLRARATALGDVSDAATVERELGDFFAWVSSRPSHSRASSRRAVGELRASPSLSGAALARTLCSTQAQLSREFHDDLGLRMVEYRARIRLMRFIDAVDAGATLTAAALAADFGSYAQCFRVFRRTLGCTPRDYFEGARANVDGATEPTVRG
jgi:AraC-like DNA-binding protein/mannose-6-phosphate isomerase-like protein (cupin superfamily)